ncbi:MAG: Flp pilus assembly protein CpaB [Pseudomonadota bacterium]
MQPTQLSGGRSKALLIFAISLCAAMAAVMLVYRVVRVAQLEVARAKATPSAVEVVVAARDLNVGVPIGPDDVAVRAMEPEMVPGEGVFHAATELQGRVPRERILANELVREGRLAVADAGVGLNALVSPGKRAMSVAVDAETGVAGFIQPGNYVDVIVTIRPDDTEGQKSWASKAFLQGVRVLAVGQRLDASSEEKTSATKGAFKKSSREKPTVTLELDLEQAEELALSATRGDIHLVLRNDIDITQQDTQGVMASRLVGHAPEARATPRLVHAVEPATPRSEIISGDQVEHVQFDENGNRAETSSGRRHR